MKQTIGIKVSSTESLSKAISIIRKYEPLSISEIKERIAQGSYVISCEYTDDNKLKVLIDCYKELSLAGAALQIYEHNRPCELRFIQNLSNTYQEISDEIDLMNEEY